MDNNYEASKFRLLEANRIDFVKRINVPAILPHLAGTLSRSDMEYLHAQWKLNGNNAASLLLDKLVRRDDWVEGLVQALRSDDVNLNNLADILDPNHLIPDIIKH
ncbi:unnamed protein product [Owenia fusiformis]|uniref:Caspase recruitment domain-containing protein n=1 Tax=Owenia fusiformis TaxID=6347 RepID=A0A8S4QA96_OWEFU|nr:unnamed protein product [Owenia fusiformis]